MRTIYQHQLTIAQTNDGLFLVNGYTQNDRPLNLEWVPLTSENSSQGPIQLEMTSKWLVDLYRDENQNWQGMVRSIGSQLEKPALPATAIYFDADIPQFYLHGHPLPNNYLTDLEHRLLAYLYQRMGRVCTYQALAQHVWFGLADDNTICQSVYRLRRKLKRMSPNPEEHYIETCRGFSRGYMLLAK